MSRAVAPMIKIGPATGTNHPQAPSVKNRKTCDIDDAALEAVQMDRRIIPAAHCYSLSFYVQDHLSRMA